MVLGDASVSGAVGSWMLAAAEMVPITFAASSADDGHAGELVHAGEAQPGAGPIVDEKEAALVGGGGNERQPSGSGAAGGVPGFGKGDQGTLDSWSAAVMPVRPERFPLAGRAIRHRPGNDRPPTSHQRRMVFGLGGRSGSAGSFHGWELSIA